MIFQKLSKPLANRMGSKASGSPLVIAVTSPHGSTGKTTVAINLAMELASLRHRVLLIDADLSGASVANHFILTEHSAGIAAALRIASQNRFDLAQLERLSLQIPKSDLRVLPGSQIGAPSDLEETSIGHIIETARGAFDFTVVDLGSIAEPESTTSQAVVTRSIASRADKTLIVAAADPIGVFRLLRSESKINELSPNARVVFNRVRNSVIEKAREEIAITIARLSNLEVLAYLPDDPQAIDQALRSGVPASVLSRTSSFRQALTGFVRAEFLAVQGSLDSRVTKLG